jgi:hypothetical protein
MSFEIPDHDRTFSVPPSVTLIVRVTTEAAGRITGTVERVQTGQKFRIDGIEGIARAIAEALGHSRGDG